MCGWIEAVKEVHRSGGRIAVSEMFCPLDDIRDARRRGMIEPGIRGGGRHMAVITKLGLMLVEGRIERKVRRSQSQKARSTRCGLRATWLASLPSANEVRVSA